MRDVPESIDAVTMKPSSELVVNSALIKMIKGLNQHFTRFCIRFIFSELLKQKNEVGGFWEFRSLRFTGVESEPTVLGIKLLRQCLKPIRDRVFLESKEWIRAVPCKLQLSHLSHPICIVAERRWRLQPDRLNPLQQCQKTSLNATVAISGGEIRPSKKWFCLGRQEHRQRPAPTAAGAGKLIEYIKTGHVDLVDVRPLLTIDLDANKTLVEKFGDLFITKCFPLHDVAPVATGITDRQENELALPFGFL